MLDVAMTARQATTGAALFACAGAAPPGALAIAALEAAALGTIAIFPGSEGQKEEQRATKKRGKEKEGSFSPFFLTKCMRALVHFFLPLCPTD